LELERFLGRGCHPKIEFLRLRKDNGHGLGVNRANKLVRVCSQEREEVVCRPALPPAKHPRSQALR
jgi:hypothetical protein